MAVLKIVTVLLFGISFVLASPLPNQPNCPSAQIISARGSGEEPGEGKIGLVAAAIAATRPRSQRDAVDYPARLIPYSESSSEGTAALTKQLTGFVERCPNSKIVLLGYSQGAHIIGDSLCGGGGVSGIGPKTKPIPKRIGDHVTAVIMFGDPRFIQNQPYNVGDADGNGLFPRRPDQSCNRYANRIRSYCDNGDIFCERGNDLDVHFGYVDKYLEEAVAFVNSRLRT